jgi:hypothetical protein
MEENTYLLLFPALKLKEPKKNRLLNEKVAKNVKHVAVQSSTG